MSYQRIVVSSHGAPEVLQLVEEPQLPQPKADEVRIKVHAASVSFTDTMIRTGSYLEVRDKPPFTPGYDAVGVVDAVGSAVSGWQVGDRAAALTITGGYSQYVTHPAATLVRVPEDVDDAQAAVMMLSYTTAYQMLHRVAQVQTGQRILVHAGSGAVGLALLELAQLAGVDAITTASAAKHPLVTAFDATAINYHTEDFVRRTLDWTDGKGVDAAFDTISFDYFKRSFSCLNKSGTLVAYGVYQATAGLHDKRGGKVLGDVGKFYGKRLWWKLRHPARSAQFYVITQLRTRQPQWFQEDVSALFQLAAEGKIQPRIYRTLPLTEAATAHRWVEAKQPQGKVVLLPWTD